MQCTLVAHLLGWLAEDAVLVETKGGQQVCSFRIACQHYSHKKREKETLWFNCTLWGSRGESLRPMLRKGGLVSVYGTIKDVKQLEVTVIEMTPPISKTAKAGPPAPVVEKKVVPKKMPPPPDQQTIEELF